MDSFEQAFGHTEGAAASLLKTATDMVKQARQMQKAAKDGNITALKKTQAVLDAAMQDLQQAVAIAKDSWPFPEEEEERYLWDSYSEEFLRAAAEQDLTVHARDGQLISHPSIVRILPKERAVRIDRKKVSGIRPSSLVALLLQNQRKRARYKANAFLEALYKVYAELTKEESKGRLVPGSRGRVVPLARIYNLFTSLPGSRRDYSTTDFARDIFLLDQSGVRETKSGLVVSFPSSTGTRSSRDVFSFVGPDGQDAKYYGVRFVQVNQ